MKINWTKVISLAGSFVSIIFSFKWMTDSHYEPEPIITTIGLAITIFVQLSFWKNKNEFVYRLKRGNPDDTTIEQVLNFLQYKYIIKIKPKLKAPTLEIWHQIFRGP